MLVGGQTIWPVAYASEIALEIPVDDLLSYLVEYWGPLTLRQTYPIRGSAIRPIDLRVEAEQRWNSEPSATAEHEDAALCAFEEAHDFTRAFSGHFDLSPLFLLRRGDRMIVDTRAGYRLVDYADAVQELTRLGDEIAARLATTGDRWTKLIDLWQRREAKDPLTLLGWSTGLPRAVAERLSSEGLLAKPASFAEVANDDDELRIAARMAGALPSDQIAAVLRLASEFPKCAAPGLDALAANISSWLYEGYETRRPHEQGELAAGRVRERIDADRNESMDIAEVLESLGVRLEFRAVEPSVLRALAIDGPRHGPTVFINLKAPLRAAGKSQRWNWSARVDLAHEFGHLLLDRGHALGAVEVLNSRMPAEVEQRAKSFAGELLAPTRQVGEAWRKSGRPRTLKGVSTLIFELQKSFGVTKAVATWKLQHATQRENVEISHLLDRIEPFR